jgi:hypothetical protein
VHPDAVFAARDLGRIGTALYDASDADGVTRFARPGGNDDAIAHVEA